MVSKIIQFTSAQLKTVTLPTWNQRVDRTARYF